MKAIEAAALGAGDESPLLAKWSVLRLQFAYAFSEWIKHRLVSFEHTLDLALELQMGFRELLVEFYSRGKCAWNSFCS